MFRERCWDFNTHTQKEKNTRFSEVTSISDPNRLNNYTNL